MPKRTDMTNTQLSQQGWDYMVRRKDGSVSMYSDHEDAAEWIKADIDAGHEVTRITQITTT